MLCLQSKQAHRVGCVFYFWFMGNISAIPESFYVKQKQYSMSSLSTQLKLKQHSYKDDQKEDNIVNHAHDGDQMKEL